MPLARTLLLLCLVFLSFVAHAQPLADPARAGGPSSVIAAGTVGVSGLIPAWNAANDRANRLKCASNLRQIGQACLIYTCDNRIYPTHLGLLISRVGVHPSILTSPRRGTVIPPAVLRGTPEQQSEWAENHTDYVYLGVGITPSHPATVILAHELILDPAQEGINILYNDGHVEWHAMPSALQEIEKQKELRKPRQN